MLFNICHNHNFLFSYSFEYKFHPHLLLDFFFFRLFVFNQLVFKSLFRRAYTASLGETAVAFDFGPLSAVPKNVFGQKGKDEVVAYPLYILRENGETFLMYVSLVHR